MSLDFAANFDRAITKTVSGAKKVAGKTAQTATTVIDYTKLQIDRAVIRDRIRILYTELGKLCYADGGTDRNALEMRECKQKLDEQFAALKSTERGRTAKEPKKSTCKTCGFCTAENPADNVYCAKCGEKL